MSPVVVRARMPYVPAPTMDVRKVAARAAGAIRVMGVPRPARIGPRIEPPPIP
jgi:hypothetical protein